MDVLAKNLRARAANLGMTLADVARRSGVSERRFGNYVAGTRNPDLDTLLRIARALQTTPNDLLGFDTGGGDHLRKELVAGVLALDEQHLETVLLQIRALVRHP